MNNPLVSVIVPNYNHAQFLPERMESILGQTYQNFEVIILDDCSTDNSREVIEQYRDNPHVSKIVYNDVNTGKPFVQWRKGIEMAKGELVWIAESDDSCDKHLLEKLVPFVESENLVYAFCRTQKVDENGKAFEVCQKEFKDTKVFNGDDFIRNHLIWTCIVINASSAILKRSAALQLANNYLDFKGSGDWMFWIEMAEKGRVGFFSETLNNCRRLRTSVTHKQNVNGNMFIENYKIYEYLLKGSYLSGKLAFAVRFWTIYHVMHLSPEMSLETKEEIYRVWKAGRMFRFKVDLGIFFMKIRKKL